MLERTIPDFELNTLRFLTTFLLLLVGLMRKLPVIPRSETLTTVIFAILINPDTLLMYAASLFSIFSGDQITFKSIILVVNVSGVSNKTSILTGFIPKIWLYLAIWFQGLDQTLCQVAQRFSRKSLRSRQKRSWPFTVLCASGVTFGIRPEYLFPREILPNNIIGSWLVQINDSWNGNNRTVVAAKYMLHALILFKPYATLESIVNMCINLWFYALWYFKNFVSNCTCVTGEESTSDLFAWIPFCKEQPLFIILSDTSVQIKWYVKNVKLMLSYHFLKPPKIYLKVN